MSLLLLGAVVAAPATAHDVLLESEPGDGEVVDEVPQEVVLTFSADQLDLGAVIQVVDAEEGTWDDGDTVVDGDQVRVPIDQDIPSGDYTVQWRSVASDGHPITGAFAFTLEVPEPEEVVEEDEASPVPEEPAAQEEEEEEEVVPAPQPDPEPTPEAPQEEDGGWLVPVVIGAAVLGALIGGLLWWRRSRGPEQ